MADQENELNSSDDKTEVKEDVSQSEEKLSTEKDDETDVPADASSKEEKKAKVDKNRINDDKKAKSEKSVKITLKKEDDQEDEDSEDEDDEEELPPGLLERPLEVEGKREKKKVERLSASMIRSPQEKKKLEIEEGSGTKLCDISYVEHQLNITKAIDLKHLHRVLYLRAGVNNEVKKNIRQFSGFIHSEDSKEHEKRVAILNKLVTVELKAICVVLGLERSGTKGNLVDRVMDFLMKPEDKGLKAKNKAKKRSASTGGKTKGTKKKKTKEAGKKGKVDKSDNSPRDSSDEEDEEEDEEEAEEEQEDEEEEDEESDYEAPKKKKAKTESKKKPPKKSAKENGKKEKPAPKETKKPAAKKRAVADSDSVSEDDSEDEPIAKMKKSPPSNEEIKDLVKNLLNGADLEKVTMKTVVKQVYSKYPSFDLSDRKDLIKDTVREVIS